MAARKEELVLFGDDMMYLRALGPRVCRSDQQGGIPCLV